MSETAAALRDFIQTERERYEVYDNNIFAIGLRQVARYHDFLTRILARYNDAGAGLRRGLDAFQATMVGHPPSGRLTPEQMKLLAALADLSAGAELEVESFYVFAKMLLDKVALFFHRYFGPTRGIDLRSHDRLTKHLDAYAAAKGLALPDAFTECVNHLKSTIADFRDKHIAHADNLRIIRGAGVDSNNRPVLTTSALYPKETDTQAMSRDLNELMGEIDGYLCELRDVIERNRARTCLKLLKPAP